MKIAITSEGSTPDSMVDTRFGRASFIVIYDEETTNYETADNELNMNAVQGAGIQTASRVAALGCQAVLTGHAGPKAFRVLEAAGVAVYTGVSGTVRQAVAAILAGELKQIHEADVEGHWGG
ncbi:MAG: NifB/NifX family molybdenum-iron cluster-binding protein [Armatimonadota bacterium]